MRTSKDSSKQPFLCIFNQKNYRFITDNSNRFILIQPTTELSMNKPTFCTGIYIPMNTVKLELEFDYAIRFPTVSHDITVATISQQSKFSGYSDLAAYTVANYPLAVNKYAITAVDCNRNVNNRFACKGRQCVVHSSDCFSGRLPC